MIRINYLLIFSGLLTVVKAHHFIKLIILAGLGLAGLWMVHTLAQDYNRISGHGGGGASGKFFEKRSISEVSINWEYVLSRDPAKCARSFICQLASAEKNDLDQIQRNILKITRLSSESESWASTQLREALKYGENVSNPSQCMKLYKLCPYSSQMMTSLLRIFGG